MTTLHLRWDWSNWRRPCQHEIIGPLTKTTLTITLTKTFFFVSSTGMVQICSSCNEKHAHMAEGSTAATTFDGRYTPSDNKSQTNSESSNVRFKVKEKNTFY